MIVNCPQCSQRIDLGASNVTPFACPECNCEIKLEVTKGAIVPADEKKDPSPNSDAVKNGKKTNQAAISPLKFLMWLLIPIGGIPLGKCMGNVFKDIIAKSQGYDRAWLNQQSSPPQITPEMLSSSEDFSGVPPTREGIIGRWQRQNSLPANRQGGLFAPQPEYFKFSSDQKFEHGNIPQLGGTQNSMSKGDYRLNGHYLHLAVDGTDDSVSYKVWMKNGDLVLEMPGQWQGSKRTITYQRISK
ncbi:MAG: hypothetical protein ABJQ29_15550 [Luteolibacter sp.]